MLDFSRVQNYYIACGYTDMRKQIDGLVAVVELQFKQKLDETSIFLFCGRRADRIKALYWDDTGYVLLYKRLSEKRFQWPRNEQELKDEGKRLHHCVGTYAESHAAGGSSIFFIRRASNPDKPWYTLNLDDKRLTVRMNLGNHNCKTTDEVKAFEEAWIAWVRAGAKQKKNNKEVSAA